MNAAAIYKNEWSATTLGFVASTLACVAVAIMALIVMGNFNFPGVTWTMKDVLFVVFFSFSQLLANTLHHSPVSRHGNAIEGMTFSDLGDSEVKTTVRQWVLQWFVSVLCASTVFTTIGILIIYALKSSSLKI
ncbi:MAG TPA: hypothetical protein VJH71_01215 [Candidatus Paceibacterota bacterium]